MRRCLQPQAPGGQLVKEHSIKRFFAACLVLAALAPASFAQTGDARAQGLAGAMTAVSDDMNALFYNPAGLAFVRKGYFSVEGNAGVAFNQSITDPFASIPHDIYAVDDGHGVSAYYYTYAPGENPQSAFVFGIDDQAYLTELRALAQADGRDYDSLMPGMKRAYYSELIGLSSFYNATQSITGSPRVTVGGRYWGLSGFADYEITPLYAAGTQATVANLDYLVSRKLGAIAGFGIALGPVAIGANAKYIESASYVKSITPPPSGLSGANVQELLLHVADPAMGEFQDTRMEIGLGAILTLGMANIGIYNDNVTPFLHTGYAGNYLDDFLGTMNFGLSLTPFDNKFSTTRSPFQAIATIDLKNFGDSANRQLCAGLEAGLNLGDFLVASTSSRQLRESTELYCRSRAPMCCSG